jgi:site-specific DNA-adenine methylase
MWSGEKLESNLNNHPQDYSQLVDLRHCNPIVKWAGGKTQILSDLDAIIPSQFNRYFEPFLGGGAMFFHLVSDRNMRFSAFLFVTPRYIKRSLK